MLKYIKIKKNPQTQTDAKKTKKVTKDNYDIKLSDKSWCSVEYNFLKISKQEFDALWSLRPTTASKVVLYGKEMVIPRRQRLYGKSSYRFSNVTVESEPIDHPIIQKVLDEVNEREPTIEYNGILVNWYKDGSEYIGPHSDDEKDLVDNAPIYSVSLGQERVFRIHPKGKGKYIRDIMMEDGMLIKMCGNMQKEYKHSVPANKKYPGPRINLTIRAFK